MILFVIQHNFAYFLLVLSNIWHTLQKYSKMTIDDFFYYQWNFFSIMSERNP